mgnify:CR=1 FL=1
MDAPARPASHTSRTLLDASDTIGGWFESALDASSIPLEARLAFVDGVQVPSDRPGLGV